MVELNIDFQSGMMVVMTKSEERWNIFFTPRKKERQLVTINNYWNQFGDWNQFGVGYYNFSIYMNQTYSEGHYYYAFTLTDSLLVEVKSSFQHLSETPILVGLSTILAVILIRKKGKHKF